MGTRVNIRIATHIYIWRHESTATHTYMKKDSNTYIYKRERQQHMQAPQKIGTHICIYRFIYGKTATIFVREEF